MNSGIYKIINIITKDFYIGSSCNLTTRKNVHFSQLKNNKHNNKYLQSVFNKYGEINLIFEILIYCPREKLLENEQYYIDTLNPKYNILKKAGNSLGYKHTEESLLKIKEKAKLNTSNKNKRKKLYQYDINFNLIKVWDSYIEYCNFYKISKSALWKSIKKGHKSAGFIVSDTIIPATIV